MQAAGVGGCRDDQYFFLIASHDPIHGPETVCREQRTTNKNLRWLSLALGLAWLLPVAGCSVQPSAMAPPAVYSLQYDTAAPRERVALIIPGLGQKISDPVFRLIADDYQAKGILPVLVAIDWKRVGLHGFTTAAAQIGSGIRRAFPGARMFLFGFSFGAVVAYELSGSLHPDQVLLCSLSPMFVEDREFQFFPLRQIMQLMLKDAGHPLSYAHNRSWYFIFLYGDHDSFLINQAIIAHRRALFPNNRTIIIKNAGHKLSPAYLGAIKKLVSEIP